MKIPYEDGEILEGTDGKEKVVYDYEDDQLIGWHKEPVKGK